MTRAEQAANIKYPNEDFQFTPRWIGFIDGYEQAERDFTEWHDPKDPPPQRKVVLLKYKIRIKEGKEYKERTVCRTGYYIFDEYVCHDRCMELYRVKGWREIHE